MGDTTYGGSLFDDVIVTRPSIEFSHSILEAFTKLK